MRQNWTYLQMALLCFVDGAVAHLVKMHTFPWGNVAVWHSRTFNDIWYFNMEAQSHAAICSSLACVLTFIAETNRRNLLVFYMKYLSILLAFVMCVRAIFHVVTYNQVSIIEAAVDIGLLIYTYRRADKWYKENIKRHEQPTA